eukprot:m.1458943 g.1458943  ORF g.1458943 m.1458943 type:complete len:1217 (+) comp25123_c0_seq30:3403-7053(+)
MGLLILVAVLVLLSIAVIVLAYYYDHEDDTSVWNRLYIAYVVVFYYAELWTVFNQAEMYFSDGLYGVGGAHAALIALFWLFSSMSVYRYTHGTDVQYSRTVLQGLLLLIPYEAFTLVYNGSSHPQRRTSRLIFDAAVGSSEILMTIPLAAIQIYSTKTNGGDDFVTIVSVVVACTWNAIASSSYNGRSYANLKEDFETSSIADKAASARAEAKGATSESTIWANYLQGGSGWRGLFVYPYFAARLAESVVHVCIFATTLLWWAPSIALLYVWRVGVYFGADTLRRDVRDTSRFNRLLMATAFFVTWFDDPRRVSLFRMLDGPQKTARGLGDVVLRDTAKAAAAPIVHYRHYVFVLTTEIILIAALSASGLTHEHIDAIHTLAIVLGAAFSAMVLLFHATWQLSSVSNKFAYRPADAQLLFSASDSTRAFNTALTKLKTAYSQGTPSTTRVQFRSLQLVSTPTSDHLGLVHGMKYTATLESDFMVILSAPGSHGRSFQIHCRHVFGNTASNAAVDRATGGVYTLALDFLDIAGLLCIQPKDEEECMNLYQTLHAMMSTTTDRTIDQTTEDKDIAHVDVVPSMLTHRHAIPSTVTLRCTGGKLAVIPPSDLGTEASFYVRLHSLRVFDFQQNGVHRIGIQLIPLPGHGNKIVFSDCAEGDIASLRMSLVQCIRECESGKVNTDYRFSHLTVEPTYLSEYLLFPKHVDVCIAHTTMHFLNADSGRAVHQTPLCTLGLQHVSEDSTTCTLYVEEVRECILQCMEGAYLSLSPAYKLGNATDTNAETITFEDLATVGLTTTVPVAIQEVGFNDTIARETMYSSVTDAWHQDVHAASGVPLRHLRKPRLHVGDLVLASQGRDTAISKLRQHKLSVHPASQMLSPAIAQAIGRSRTLAECGLHLDPMTGRIQGCILNPGKFTFHVGGNQRVGCLTMSSKQRIVVHVYPRNGVDRIVYDGMVVDSSSTDVVPTATVVVKAGRRSQVPRVESALDSGTIEQWFNMRRLRADVARTEANRRHDSHALWSELEQAAGQVATSPQQERKNNDLVIYKDGSILALGKSTEHRVEVFVYPGNVSRPLGLQLVKNDVHNDITGSSSPPTDAMMSVYPRLRLQIVVEDDGYTSSTELSTHTFTKPTVVLNPTYEQALPAQQEMTKNGYLEVQPDAQVGARGNVTEQTTANADEENATAANEHTPCSDSDEEEDYGGFSAVTGIADDGVDYDD